MEAYKVLVKVVASMRAGDSPLKGAANFLGISRPTLVKLLEQGEISYERPASGRHRRLRLNDVLDYQRRKRADRRATLDVLTEQAAEAGPYDGVPDYTEALNAARKRRAG
jgi:excisionase family DNA binding protein